MMANNERTYSTVFVPAEKPIDLDVFCALVAKQFLSQNNKNNKGDFNNGRKVQ